MGWWWWTRWLFYNLAAGALGLVASLAWVAFAMIAVIGSALLLGLI